VVRGQIVSGIARELNAKGFCPDLIAGHPGWGETLFLRDCFPRARILSYCEFYYRGEGADVGFDPEFPARVDEAPRLRARNMTHLSGLGSADLGLSPTRWQRSLDPLAMQSKIEVLHEGIDTAHVRPDPGARLEIERPLGVLRRSPATRWLPMWRATWSPIGASIASCGRCRGSWPRPRGSRWWLAAGMR
jgi:hypothetical protein